IEPTPRCQPRAIPVAPGRSAYCNFTTPVLLVEGLEGHRIKVCIVSTLLPCSAFLSGTHPLDRIGQQFQSSPDLSILRCPRSRFEVSGCIDAHPLPEMVS